MKIFPSVKERDEKRILGNNQTYIFCLLNLPINLKEWLSGIKTGAKQRSS